jgi:hypothetical protein
MNTWCCAKHALAVSHVSAHRHPLPRCITPAFCACVARLDPENGFAIPFSLNANVQGAILPGVAPLTTGESTAMCASEWLGLISDCGCGY